MTKKKTNKEQYLKAVKIVEDYQREFSKNVLPKYVCIVCKEQEIKPIDDEHIPPPMNQEYGMWRNGTVRLINFGYGSIHDLCSYYVGICDDCITRLKAEKLIIDYKELLKKMKGEEVVHKQFNEGFLG